MGHGNVIEVLGVSRIYKSGKVTVRALDSVDLVVRNGDFMAVAGPSGSGKTTLLNIMGGLDEPTAGKVRLEGRELGTLSRKELARLRLRRIGFVFQAYNLIPVLTAYENVEYPLILAGVETAERRRRVQELLDAVGIGDLGHRRPNELSGGQQQRVAIARALVMKPAVVLADEPTANLDSTTAKALLDLMARLNEERGTTFVFSTHDPLVMQAARRLVQLRDGKVVDDQRR